MAETVLAKMAVEISANAAKFTTAVNQAQGQFKGLTSAVASANKILSTFGVGFGAFAIINGLKSVVGIMSEFEATMSEVRAITGATGAEFQSLEKDALRLGAATKFTSQEVGQLQIAYGRLGFNTKEILDATEATLDLAAATGEDLAKAADVAGSTVRGFGLNAKETQRVVDVMAKSFNTTALGLENFTEAMKFVAPVAAAANLSVEETTALLGTLADAGIRGSIAGTSLRKILTDLPRDARPFQERLAELAAKGITVSDAFDEVGRTAQTSLLILAKNNEKTKELAASFSDVAGEAARVARIMQDNLQGDVEKLTSAFEGLILTVTSSQFFRDFTQQMTEFLNFTAGAGKSLDKIFKDITFVLTENGDLNKFSNKDITANLDQYVEQLKQVRREQGRPFDLKIVEELSEKYNLSSRAVGFLRQSLEKANEALSFQETVLKNFRNSDIAKTYGETKEAVDKYIDSLNAVIIAQTNESQALKQLAIDTKTDIFQGQISAAENQIESALRQISILRQFAEGLGGINKDLTGSIAGVVISLKSYKDALKSLNEEFEHVVLGARGFDAVSSSNLRVLASEIVATEGLVKSVERLKESFRNPINFELDFKVPDLSKFLNPITTQTRTEGGLTFDLDVALDDAMVDRFEKRLEETRQATQRTVEGIQSDFKGLDLRGLITNSLDGIGESIGLAIAGAEDLGKSLLKVFGGILGQFGKMLIAAGTGIIIAKKAFTSLNGYVAIAAGVALVALGAAVSASIKGIGNRIGNATGGLGGSSSGSGSTFTPERAGAQVILVGGEIRWTGSSLTLALNKAAKDAQRGG